MSRKIINYKTSFGRFKQIAKYYKQIMPIISEGDSWFSYPLAGKNIMDNLVYKFEGTINYFRLESSGHVALDMFADCNDGQLEKFKRLVKHYQVPIVLISAGGNDIVGEGLLELLNEANNPTDVDSLINSPKLKQHMEKVLVSYETMINCLIAVNPDVRIIGHTYDYPIVSGDQAPVSITSLGIAAPIINLFKQIGPWIKPHLTAKNLTDSTAQNTFATRLIDKFHDTVLVSLKNQYSNFDYVDLRGTLEQNPEMWSDEIHPSMAGFSKLADKVWLKLKPLIETEYQKWLTRSSS